MPAKKKPAAKKRTSKKKPSGEIVPFVPSPFPEDEDLDPAIVERLETVERWREVYELRKAGVSFPKIAAQFNFSTTTAFRYNEKYEKYRGASPKIEAERAYQLATFAELEVKLWREGVRGEASWAVVAREIRGLYQDRRDILGFDQAEPAAPSGVLGADGQPDAGTPVEIPAEVTSILDRLTA